MDLKNVIAHFAILKPKYPISQLDSGKLNTGQYEVVLVESEGSGKLSRATKELPSFLLSRDSLQKSTQLLSIVADNVLDKIGQGSNAKRCLEVPVGITEKDRQVLASSSTVQPLRPTSMLQNENVSPTQKTAPLPLGPKPKYSVPPPIPSRTPLDGNTSSENVLFVVPISPEFTTSDNPPSVTNVVKNATLPHFYTLNLALDAGDKGRGGPFTSSKSTLFFLKRIESWLEDRILVPGAIEKLFAEVAQADTTSWNPLYFQETVISPPSPNSKSNNTFANFTNNSIPPVSPSSNGPNAQTRPAASPRNTVDIFIPNPRFMRKKALDKLESDARASGSAKVPATALVHSTNEPEQLPPVSSEIRAIAASATSPGSTSSQQKPASGTAGASGAPTTGAAASSGVSTDAAAATATGTVKSASKSETKSESVSIEMHDEEENVVIAMQQASKQEAPQPAKGTPLC